MNIVFVQPNFYLPQIQVQKHSYHAGSCRVKGKQCLVLSWLVVPCLALQYPELDILAVSRTIVLKIVPSSFVLLRKDYHLLLISSANYMSGERRDLHTVLQCLIILNSIVWIWPAKSGDDLVSLFEVRIYSVDPCSLGFEILSDETLNYCLVRREIRFICFSIQDEVLNLFMMVTKVFTLQLLHKSI